MKINKTLKNLTDNNTLRFLTWMALNQDNKEPDQKVQSQARIT